MSKIIDKNIGLIILVRTGSKRLPKKCFKKINNKPLLSYVYERCLKIVHKNNIIIATTKLKEDDQIYKFSQKNKIKCFRGSEKNVFKRFYDCAKINNFNYSIRVNADSPLINFDEISKALIFTKYKKYDIITNSLIKTFPKGMAVEIISQRSLNKAKKYIKTSSDKMHVTTFFYKNKKKFNIKNIINYKKFKYCKNLSVDTINDLKLVSFIYKKMNYKLKNLSLKKYDNIVKDYYNESI